MGLEGLATLAALAAGLRDGQEAAEAEAMELRAASERYKQVRGPGFRRR